MKIPGFLYTLGIAVAIFAAQTLLPQQYAIYGSMAVVILLGVAKAMSLGDADEVDAIVADLHAAQVASGLPRGVVPPKLEPRSKLERWLVG